MGDMHPVAQPPTALGVIIVAAGRGERLGAMHPKAFVELDGVTLLQHCVRTVTALPHTGQLVIVVPEGFAAHTHEVAASASDRWQISVVTGGRERHESVRSGIAVLNESVDTVLVHDAARPLTPPEVFERVIEAVCESGGAVVPFISVADTLKRVTDDGTVLSTEDRRSLIAVQTPQGFARNVLEEAHREAAKFAVRTEAEAPTDDAEVVQRFGGTVHTVVGSTRSHKITGPDDLLMLEGLLTKADAQATGAHE